MWRARAWRPNVCSPVSSPSIAAWRVSRGGLSESGGDGTGRLQYELRLLGFSLQHRELGDMRVALDERRLRAETGHCFSVQRPNFVADRMVMRVDDEISMVFVSGEVKLADTVVRNTFEVKVGDRSRDCARSRRCCSRRVRDGSRPLPAPRE